MCEYHLYPGDMFKTENGIGIIVKKKNGKFYYNVVFRANGGKPCTGTSRIPTGGFYESLDDGVVQEVYLVPNKKYRRKRNRT